RPGPLLRSRRQLYCLCHKELATGTAQFSRVLRPRYGSRLLSETTHSTADLSIECGFTDNAHFSRRFREQFGATPAQVRKRETGRSRRKSNISRYGRIAHERSLRMG